MIDVGSASKSLARGFLFLHHAGAGYLRGIFLSCIFLSCKGCRNSNAKGQIAVETLLVLAFLLALLIPVVYVLYATMRAREWSADAYSAHVAVARIADAAGKLAYGGGGARIVLSIYFPPSVVALTARGQELMLVLDTELGRIDVAVLAPVNVSATEPMAPRGMQRIALNFSEGVVWLSLERE